VDSVASCKVVTLWKGSWVSSLLYVSKFSDHWHIFGYLFHFPLEIRHSFLLTVISTPSTNDMRSKSLFQCNKLERTYYWPCENKPLHGARWSKPGKRKHNPKCHGQISYQTSLCYHFTFHVGCSCWVSSNRFTSKVQPVLLRMEFSVGSPSSCFHWVHT